MACHELETLAASLRLLNPALFTAENGDPMYFSFIIKCSHKKKAYADLTRAGSGYVHDEKSIDERTAIMVEEAPSLPTNRPVFELAYLRECVFRNTLLDIVDYMYPTKINFEGRKGYCMDILYFHNRKFPVYDPQDIVLTVSRATSSNKNSKEALNTVVNPIPLSDDPEAIRVLRGKGKPRSEDRSRGISFPEKAHKLPTYKRLQEQDSEYASSNEAAIASTPSTSSETFADLIAENELVNTNGPSASKNETSVFTEIPAKKTFKPLIDENAIYLKRKMVDRRTRQPYTYEEKAAILKHLVKFKKFTGLRGDSVWKSMVARDICPRRSHQSLKEHFAKVIVYQLDEYPFLTKEHKKIFQQFAK